MALQAPAVYRAMQTAFLLYEDGGLKGQKVNNWCTEVAKMKSLQGQYSAKAHHFKMFQGLQVK